MKRIVFFSLCLCVVFAQCALAAPRIKIIGRPTAVITQQDVRLSDICDIESSSSVDDEAVIGLKKIRLMNAPLPGETQTIGALEIIAKLKDQGVNTDEIIYTLPRTMKIERAGRVLGEGELQAAILNYIQQNQLATEIRSIRYEQPVTVPTGAVILAVQSSSAMAGNQRAFQVAVLLADGTSYKSFSVPTQVQEFRTIPVAKKPLPRGSMITEADIQMARFNIESLPLDALQGASDIVGQETKNEIQPGEVFRANKIAPPIAIAAGSPVTMKYQSEFFEATASGVALENGGIGQEIKVRNDASKKVVSGQVLEAGIVRVQ
jgi:flagella basal body P-ring formation protein FlgA